MCGAYSEGACPELPIALTNVNTYLHQLAASDDAEPPGVGQVLWPEHRKVDPEAS